MAALSTFPRWTIENYLEMEQTSMIRHEYLDGLVHALPDSTQRHGVIVVNAAALAHAALRGAPCLVYSSSIKIRATERHLLYADISITCEPGDHVGTAYWIAAPRVVVEVLSEGTAAYDRGDKFAVYRQIATLRDYVLVETERQRAEVHSRQEGGAWTMRAFAPGAVAALPSLDLHLPLDEIYEDTDVPTA
jgi:Uma2 family endonuclease